MVTTGTQTPASGAAGALRSIALTAALDFGLALALVYAYTLAAGIIFLPNLIVLPLTILGTAAGSAFAVRVPHVSWRQTVLAALLSAGALIAFSRLQGTPFHPGPWIPVDGGMQLDFRVVLVYLAVVAAGTFLLPLLDPAVRRTGPAPSPWKVALAALALLLFVLIVDYLAGGLPYLGLVTLILGSIGAAVLVGLGVLLVIFKATAAGAWVGGLGIVSEALTLIVWRLLGMPFFP